MKDGIVLDMQEKIGKLHVEIENLEMERRQVRRFKKKQKNCAFGFYQKLLDR